MNDQPELCPTPILDVAGLRKNYVLDHRIVEVLRGVDLRVDAGEFLALRGASGTGKSTLLHLLAGLDSPTAGVIRLHGEDIAASRPRLSAHQRNRRIGLIFQAYNLLPELDALENVCLPGRLARRTADEVESHARSLLERVGLGHRFEHRPAELSGGEQQRVAIARALVNHPMLLLADEPTGNLDSQTGLDIIRLLESLWREQRVTLIIATHDSRVAAAAPRALELAEGILRP